MSLSGSSRLHASMRLPAPSASFRRPGRSRCADRHSSRGSPRPKAEPGATPTLALRTMSCAKRQAVLQPVDMQEAVKGAVRLHPADAVLAVDEILHHIAALARSAASNSPRKASPCGDSAASAPYCAKCVAPVLLAWAIIRIGGRPAILGCTSQPMRQPVIAQGLEKLLMTNTASSSLGDLQERRRMRRAVIDQRAVDFVADDGDAASRGEIQDRLLFVRASSSSRWDCRARR